MLRLSGALVVVITFVVSDLWAGETRGFFERFGQDYHRNNCWPEPFLQPDRAHVFMPLVAMVNKGWQKQNLLAGYHFVPNSLRLNEAGQLKVIWILTQTPHERRTIFVSRGFNPDVTAARLEAAEHFAQQITPAGTVPLVVESYMVAEGRPAQDVDATNVRFRETRPSPQLPASTSNDF